MQVVCAWCDKPLKVKIRTGQSIEETFSHTICLDCVSKQEIFYELAINGETLEFLRILSDIQIVIDKENQIQGLTILKFQETDLVISEIEYFMALDFFGEFFTIKGNNLVEDYIEKQRTDEIADHVNLYVLMTYLNHKLFVNMNITYASNAMTTIECKIVRAV